MTAGTPTTRIRMDAALTPALLPLYVLTAGTVYVVIDVVRATTTLSVLFERGVRRVLIAESIAAAREARERLGEGYLLAGESGGLPPPGFDLGNSPSQLQQAQLEGRDVIFATTNGTRALRACAGGRTIVAGSLRNARAALRAALAAAGRGVAQPPAHTAPADAGHLVEVASESDEGGAAPDIVLVCSGRGELPAFDDTLCAGALVDEGLRLAAELGVECELGEGARLGLAAWRHVRASADLMGALASSDAGRAVARVGLGADLAECAAVNVSALAPRVIGSALDGALLVMEAEP